MTAILRTLITTAAICGVILLIFWRVSIDRNQKAIEELQALNEAMQKQLEIRQQMVERLSRTRRMARIEILDQRMNDADEVAETELIFIELTDDGREVARQHFTISGDVLFVDAWTAKFDHELVAAGHPLYGRTLVLLRRIYSDRTAPMNGQPIDTPGSIPPIYAHEEMAKFERQVWKEFWRIATDKTLAATMGIRNAQGEAVYKPVRVGQAFELIVDASGGINLTPVPGMASGEGRLSK